MASSMLRRSVCRWAKAPGGSSRASWSARASEWASGWASLGGGGGAEARPVAPRAQEGRLHKILGVLDRAEHPIAVKLQLPVMALNQRGERRLLERRAQLLGGVHHQSMNRRPAGTSSAVCSVQQDQRQQPRRARRQLFEHHAPLSTSDAHRIG
jgi:hypothetical protein